jgi:glycosyltransferase involved in cell wall biosynthesis
MDICAIIPAYNTEAFIGPIIQKIREKDITPVVVNDGSHDNTEAVAKKERAVVLNTGVNSGKGAALRLGFQYALEKKFDLIFTIDSDGQHDPAEMEKFIDVLRRREEVSIVIGSRMDSRKTMPIVRWYTNKFMSFILSLLSGAKIEDSQSGFRLLRKAILENITLSTNKYEIESELLLKAARKGFAIESVPIHTIYDVKAQSKINPLIDTLRFIRFIIKNITYRV